MRSVVEIAAATETRRQVRRFFKHIICHLAEAALLVQVVAGPSAEVTLHGSGRKHPRFEVLFLLKHELGL